MLLCPCKAGKCEPRVVATPARAVKVEPPSLCVLQDAQTPFSENMQGSQVPMDGEVEDTLVMEIPGKDDEKEDLSHACL